MKKLILTVVICHLAAGIASAQTLTLDECRQLARENYPAIKQHRLIEQSRDFSLKNAAKGWLPQLSATASGYAFTDVLDMPEQMTAMTGDMKNHLLNAGVTVRQTIYDGGAIAAQKRVTKAQAEVERGQLDVQLYDINERVDQLYFGVLTLDAQLQQLQLLQDDLALSHKTVSSMMKGGIANQSDVDAVKVEQLKIQQQAGSLRASRHAYLQMLGKFIGQSLSDEVSLSATATASTSAQRPEMEFFRAQERLLDQQRRQLDAQLLPRLSAFGTGLYHNRVIGLMNKGMLAAGMTLSWNIAPLYSRATDLKKLGIAREQIDTQRKTFLFNTNMQNENADGNIQSLRKQIALDDEIIALREGIREKSEKKVQLGTETVNELLRNVNAVSEARQAKALHEIQLLKEIQHQKNINNN